MTFGWRGMAYQLAGAAGDVVGWLTTHLWSATLLGCALLLAVVAARRWLAATTRHALLLVASLQLLLPIVGIRQWLVAAAGAAAPTVVSWEGVDLALPPAPASGLADGGTLLPLALLALWIAGGLVVVGLTTISGRQLTGWRRGARAAGERELALLATIGRDGAPPRLELADVPVPLVVGLFRPRILLPRDLPPRLSDDELAAILAHEAAHARRRDPLAAAAQLVALACWWFHPLAWLLDARARRERELACDEAVLAADIPPRALLSALLSVSRHAAGPRLVAAAGITGSLTRQRKEQIMTGTRRSPRLPHRFTWLTAAVGVLAMLAMWPVAGGAAALGEPAAETTLTTGFTVTELDGAFMVDALFVTADGRLLAAPRIAVAPGEEGIIRSGTADAQGIREELVARVTVDESGSGLATWELLRAGEPVVTGEAPLAVARRADEPRGDVDLDLREAPLAEVLGTFAQLGGLTVLPVEPVEGRVSARLAGVPWDEALDQVLDGSGYGFRRVGDYLLVYPTP